MAKRKLIDLPDDTVIILDKLAKWERMRVKNFMEKILMKYAHERKSSPIVKRKTN